MRTLITFQNPPDTDFIKIGSDETMLSRNSYVKEYIHYIDIHNNITYFYPSEYSETEGFIFTGCYHVKKTLSFLHEGFDQPYHTKFIR